MFDHVSGSFNETGVKDPRQSKANWSLLGQTVGPVGNTLIYDDKRSSGGPPADGRPARREEERERGVRKRTVMVVQLKCC